MVIGHVSRDVNIIKEKTTIEPGGGIYFASVAGVRQGLRVSGLTKGALADRSLFKDMESAGVKLIYHESPKSTSCVNNYPTDNPDDRRQSFVSLAEPFTRADLKIKKVDIIHINPLWYGEFPEKLIPLVREKCKFLVADAQGFIRHVQGETIHRKDWNKKKKYLKYFDLFKLDNKEAKVLCDTEDLEVAVKKIHQWGARMVIATQADRVYLYDGPHNQLYSEPFGKYPMEGRTGRGDTVTVSFLAEMRHDKDFARALRKAAEITTLKMQYPGPYRGPTAKL
jgi:sugar/nucleoside kinase (ribokinase family)